MADKMMRVAGRGDDGTAKSLKIKNEQLLVTSKKPHKITDLYRGSVTAGAITDFLEVEYEGQDETIILVSTDKGGWTLTGGHAGNKGIGKYGSSEGFFWPIRNNNDKAWSENFPARSYVVYPSTNNDRSENYLNPTNILEAKASSIFYTFNVQYQNTSSDPQNVVLQVLKVWR